MVIYFDINETILVGDEAGGDSGADCPNKRDDGRQTTVLLSISYTGSHQER